MRWDNETHTSTPSEIMRREISYYQRLERNIPDSFYVVICYCLLAASSHANLRLSPHPSRSTYPKLVLKTKPNSFFLYCMSPSPFPTHTIQSPATPLIVRSFTRGLDRRYRPPKQGSVHVTQPPPTDSAWLLVSINQSHPSSPPT